MSPKITMEGDSSWNIHHGGSSSLDSDCSVEVYLFDTNHFCPVILKIQKTTPFIERDYLVSELIWEHGLYSENTGPLYAGDIVIYRLSANQLKE